MLGALIAGGASLISGFLGQSSAKKQAKKEEAAIREANRVAAENAAQMNLEVRSRADAAALVPVQTSRSSIGGVDMRAFLAAAEEGGFNPLTFLRSGALSHFSQSIEEACTTGERAMDAALAGQYIPQLAPVLAQTRVPGMGEVFGNALTSGASQYLQEAAEQRQFANDVFKMQLQGAQRAGAYGGTRFGTVPQMYSASASVPTAKKQATIWDLEIGETLVDGVIAKKLFLPVVNNTAAGGGAISWIVNPDYNLDSETMAGAGILTGAAKLIAEKERLLRVYDNGWRTGDVQRAVLPAISTRVSPRF